MWLFIWRTMLPKRLFRATIWLAQFCQWWCEKSGQRTIMATSAIHSPIRIPRYVMNIIYRDKKHTETEYYDDTTTLAWQLYHSFYLQIWMIQLTATIIHIDSLLWSCVLFFFQETDSFIIFTAILILWFCEFVILHFSLDWCSGTLLQEKLVRLMQTPITFDAFDKLITTIPIRLTIIITLF